MSYTEQVQKLGNGNTITYKVHPSGIAFQRSLRHKNGHIDTRETPDALCELIANLYGKKTLVRVFYGSADGCSWLDEHGICGHVGRSTGSIKIPLIVRPGADGGPGMIDSCIVRLDVQSRPGGSHATVWTHPNFHVPNLGPSVEELPLELPYCVSRLNEVSMRWEVIARFFTRAEQERWLRLIYGQRFPDERDFKAWAEGESE